MALVGRMCRTVELAGCEPIIWLGALAWLALANPDASHVTLCPLANLGISWCPGCGLGHAVGLALRGDFSRSLHEHLLGIPAILILVHRTAMLFRDAYRRTTTFEHPLTQQDPLHG